MLNRAPTTPNGDGTRAHCVHAPGGFARASPVVMSRWRLALTKNPQPFEQLSKHSNSGTSPRCEKRLRRVIFRRDVESDTGPGPFARVSLCATSYCISSGLGTVPTGLLATTGPPGPMSRVFRRDPGATTRGAWRRAGGERRSRSLERDLHGRFELPTRNGYPTVRPRGSPRRRGVGRIEGPGTWPPR